MYKKLIQTELSIDDEVKIALFNGRVLKGKLVRLPTTLHGFDYDGLPKIVEYDKYGVLGKIEGDTESVADWEVKTDQCLSVQKIENDQI